MKQPSINPWHLAIVDGRLVLAGPADQVPAISRPGRACLRQACERNVDGSCADKARRLCPEYKSTSAECFTTLQHVETCETP